MNSIAAGASATATGAGSIAVGASATATGQGSAANGSFATATGAISTANGTNATATGHGSVANGTFATATGQFSIANGSTASAFGQNSNATGDASTAIGQASVATATGATAVGTGATWRRSPTRRRSVSGATRRPQANQVAIGTATNTYMLFNAPAASLAAQSGPASLVTSDANGNPCDNKLHFLKPLQLAEQYLRPADLFFFSHAMSRHCRPGEAGVRRHRSRNRGLPCGPLACGQEFRGFHQLGNDSAAENASEPGRPVPQSSGTSKPQGMRAVPALRKAAAGGRAGTDDVGECGEVIGTADEKAA